MQPVIPFMLLYVFLAFAVASFILLIGSLSVFYFSPVRAKFFGLLFAFFFGGFCALCWHWQGL